MPATPDPVSLCLASLPGLRVTPATVGPVLHRAGVAGSNWGVNEMHLLQNLRALTLDVFAFTRLETSGLWGSMRGSR